MSRPYGKVKTGRDFLVSFGLGNRPLLYPFFWQLEGFSWRFVGELGYLFSPPPFLRIGGAGREGDDKGSG